MENFRITSLEINKIGPFDQLNLKFPLKPEGLGHKAEIHIFTGENGTGKTTLLEVIAFALGNGAGGAFLSKNRNLKDPSF